MFLPQFPEKSIEVVFYNNVSNATEIRSNITELPYAFINARTICSVEQLMSAIYRVMVEASYNRLRTKSFHSEVLLALSPTSNIGDAFKKFGINDDSKQIIVVQIIDDKDSQFDNDSVKGDIIDFNDENLEKFCDIDTIIKVYKLEKHFIPATTADLSRALVDAIQLRGL